MSWIMREHWCSSCGKVTDYLHRRSEETPEIRCECGSSAGRVPSAVCGRVKLGEVTRGKSDAPPPHVVDTRPLAEGMSLNDWKAIRRKARLDKLRSKLRE